MTKTQLNEKITEQRKKAMELLLELKKIHDTNFGTVKHKNIIKILYEEALEELDYLLDEKYKYNNNNNTKN